MSAGANIQFATSIQGVEQLAAQLKYLHEDALTVQILRKAVKAGMELAYDKAVALLPASAEEHKSYKALKGGQVVLPPGYAKTAVRVITHARSDKLGMSAIMGVRKAAYYAVQFVEIGTSKQQAQPWLRPAMASTASAQADAVAETFKERVLGVVGIAS